VTINETSSCDAAVNAAHRLGVKWLKMAGPRNAPMPIAPNSSPMVKAESRIWKAGASENLRPEWRHVQ
jgi:hypothetical protein